MSKKLKIALPKGSLQDSTVELFRKAGYNVYVSSRGYRPACDDDDLELFLICLLYTSPSPRDCS